MGSFIPPEGGVESLTLSQMAEEWPNAYFDTESLYDHEPYDTDEARARLESAGIGLVRMIEERGTRTGFFRTKDTPQVRILDVLGAWAAAGRLHGLIVDDMNGNTAVIGALEVAINDIAQGTFDKTYGKFFHRFRVESETPRQQG